MLRRSVRVELTDDGANVVEDPEALDVVGHGTACAGIIHAFPHHFPENVTLRKNAHQLLIFSNQDIANMVLLHY